MVDPFLAKLKAAARRGGRRDRASVLLPFLIISIGLGVLAWRSYNLSIKMERGVSSLARHYSGYASEIAARRVDAAVRSELQRASDEWQYMERRVAEPTFASLSDWLTQHNWIIEAIYVPDYDPASSVYAYEPTARRRATQKLSREFFTSSGTVRYSYDPQRLLTAVQGAIKQQPLVQGGGSGGGIQPQAEISFVRSVKKDGLEALADGYAFTTRLAAPLQAFGVRAIVRRGTGWSNQRIISLWASLLALVLTGVGAYLAMRGIHKESETMKLRGALIANVSHELRTPLSMIRLGAETLKLAKLKDHERKQIEDNILHEVLLLSHLVENVLDVARMQNNSAKALAFTPVHPRDLIRNVVTTYESWIRSKGFTVALQLDETVEEQMWDRDAVSRALLNLIDNAIKYSGDDPSKDKAIDVVLRQDVEYVVIEVKDRGIGIEPKDAARIFDPYYRAQFSDTITRRGAGLGLTLVQQIVESHGGAVEVESVPGSGSTFRLKFPRGLGGTAHEPAPLRTREAF